MLLSEEERQKIYDHLISLGSDPVKVVTHDGIFHADEVTAFTIVQYVYGAENVTLTRTRDPSIIKEADIVLDVGMEYDPMNGRFDHHQPEGAGMRENGILYATAGLIWDVFGKNMIRLKLAGLTNLSRRDKDRVDLLDVARNIDRTIIQGMDGLDTGTIDKPEEFLTLSDIIKLWRPYWKEGNPSINRQFSEALAYTDIVLTRAIHKEIFADVAKNLIKYKGVLDGRILKLPIRCPWKDYVIQSEAYSDALFVMFPRESGTWGLQGIPVSLKSYDLRKPLPKEWAGKRNKRLQNITEVDSAIFCHRERFMCVAGRKEDIERMAEIALRTED